MREARLHSCPAASGVERGIERGADASLPRLGEEGRGRRTVERRHDEGARDVKAPAGAEQVEIELVGAERAIGSGEVEERLLPRAVVEHHARRSGRFRVPKHSPPVDPAVVEKAEQEIPEEVGADLPHDAYGHAEAGEARGGVQSAASAAQRDLVDEPHRPPRGQALDRPGDHVRDEQPEAHHVGHGAGATPCGSRRRPRLRRGSCSRSEPSAGSSRGRTRRPGRARRGAR